MKRLWVVSVAGAAFVLTAGILFCFDSSAQAQVQPVQTVAVGKSVPPADAAVFAVSERGAHYKIFQDVRQAANRYTAIGNGMHFKDANGNWIESKPVVQSFESAIVCTGRLIA